MSRYHSPHPDKKIDSGEGWSTAANSTYPGKSAELGSYHTTGKGAPMNDMKGRGESTSPEKTANWERVWP